MPEVKNKFEVFRMQSRLNNLSIININCYLCNTLGHAAIDCYLMVIDKRIARIKERWVENRDR